MKIHASCKEKETNKEVFALAGTERSLMKADRKKQMQFVGHVYRKRGLKHFK